MVTTMSIEQAKSFLKTIKNSVVYAGIGKVGAWNENDQLIPGIENAPNSREKDFNDAIFYIKTLPNHYSLAAKRHDWADGTVYTQWNPDDYELKNKPFYCINETGFIYKCLSNNGGVESTVMPDAVTPERFETSDGYIWKMVAMVPEPTAILYNDASLVPVKTLTESTPDYVPQYLSQSAAIAGTIDRIDVIHPGLKYSDQVIITIIGDGTGAKASAIRHTITGEILKVKIDDVGVGYTQATVIVTDPSNIGGAGAILHPILSPLAGHGADPERELFATNILGSIQIQGTENGFLEDSFDFRKVFLTTAPNETVNDPMYSYTIKLNLADVSGTFVKGETVKFPNTGYATVVFVGSDYIKVSSPQTIEVGQIVGATSGANANVLTIEDTRFPIGGDVLYRHYFDKRTKLSDQNIKITPKWKF